ncbi:site-specific integrase [Methylobacterium sp. J-070]|uniref:site-specific integrase n=1 Tax=Methylobacterium sp. J-070 TaxID=2836650 RepID=UPI001FB9C635|nr:site-specific integrase [Methylobacterium sp. J-070]MCJ2053787.1 tyrosine-type recombinase/integrase [Methylobacterium sp. J-070]
MWYTTGAHMPVVMPSPWLNPRTATYYLRVRVPTELRQFVSSEVVKKSLGTKDPKIAKKRFATEYAELQARWAVLKNGVTSPDHEDSKIAEPPPPAPLTERRAHEIARAVHDEYLNHYWDNPNQPRAWPSSIFRAFSMTMGDIMIRDRKGVIVTASDNKVRSKLKSWCLEKSRQLLLQNSIPPDASNIGTMAQAVAANLKQANFLLDRLASGETELWDAKRPAREPQRDQVQQPSGEQNVIQKPSQHVAFAKLIEGWKAERKSKSKTIYEWSRVFGRLEAFLGHSDAMRLTVDDLRRWKAEMLAKGLSSKTIRDANLAPVKAIFNYALQNGLIKDNPPKSISIELRQWDGLNRRSFNDTEAETLLRAARAEIDPIRRWIPWILAFTGARLSEICQLRTADIKQTGSVWSIIITADAGSVKNRSSERTIPIHSVLLNDGFLNFVSSTKTEVLLTGLSPDKFGKRGGNGTKVLGRWVRSLGIEDVRVAPMHSLRHRFKTLCRRHGIPQDTQFAIMGHSQRTIGDSYGEFEIDVMKGEIEKIPTLF